MGLAIRGLALEFKHDGGRLTANRDAGRYIVAMMVSIFNVLESTLFCSATCALWADIRFRVFKPLSMA